ncbi:MAG: peptide deformylase [Victivallaceae bacterium]
MIRNLCYYDHPILRAKALPVVDFNDSLFHLIDDLKETVAAAKGIGLAAPQIGVSLRVFISCIKGEDEEQKLMFYDEPLVYINPILKNPGKKNLIASEGCLSIPKLKAQVFRPQSIDISYQNEKEESFHRSYSGFSARVLMHENDHLNGVLFIDRLKKEERRKLEKDLALIKKKYASFR